MPRALSLRRELRSSPAAHLSSFSACAPARVLSAENVRLKPALLRMPEGQNRGAECFAVLEFEGVLRRKIQIICDGYIGGDLPQVWSEAKVLNRLYRMFCGA